MLSVIEFSRKSPYMPAIPAHAEIQIVLGPGSRMGVRGMLRHYAPPHTHSSLFIKLPASVIL